MLHSKNTQIKKLDTWGRKKVVQKTFYLNRWQSPAYKRHDYFFEEKKEQAAAL